MPTPIYYPSQERYQGDMLAWIADIETWQNWAINETDPIMKAFYKRTLKRCMKQFLEELKQIYVHTSDVSTFNFTLWSNEAPPGLSLGGDDGEQK